MPTWGEILTEINSAAQLLHTQGAPPTSAFDFVRRKYLGLAAAQTHRPTILYATAWISNPNAPAPLVSMSDDDMHGFMEAVHGLARSEERRVGKEGRSRGAARNSKQRTRPV